MKGQNDLRPWQHRANQTEQHETLRQITADVKVNHVVAQPKQQSEDVEATPRIVHVVFRRSPVSCEVQHRARHAATSQKIA
jgi:hypothetical protein